MPVIKEKDIHVYKKELSDGNCAVGIFNIGTTTKKYTLPLEKLGLKKPVLIRDLWRQQDLGQFDGQFSTIVSPHGVTLIKIIK